MSSSYRDFFRRATGFDPFPYQERLGAGDGLPSLVEAPTGAGKTAGVAVPWLRDRVQHRTGPTRLIYCLPMRVLVDQVAGELRRWRGRLDLSDTDLGVHTMRGGELDESWEEHPERPAILVGTQDQLLSRALNRGYAMSRFRWPIHFALVHTDAWWVLDEVQLMGPGVRTAAQLQGFRERFGVYGASGTTFMSATLRPTWLATPDFAPREGRHVTLDAEDRAQPALSKRTTASKPVAMAPDSDPKTLGPWIAETHEPGSLTLVVVNRVSRAQDLAKRLRKAADAEVLLLHSRFRPAERSLTEEGLGAGLPDAGRIVVATQTVEAGVDISARTLVTDLAPWPSLVQRFGRCNRRGELSEGKVYWVDLDSSKRSAPYTAEALDAARGLLTELDDARIDGLPAVQTEWPTTDLPRTRDLLDLFDTDPDLDGNFVDISRWVRGDGATDAIAYWRTVEGDAPPTDEPKPHRDELCSVPIESFRKFVRKHRGEVWHWDALEGRWSRAHTDRSAAAPGFVVPGQRYLIHADAGGYEPLQGWTGKGKHTPPIEPTAGPGEPSEAYGDDRRSVRKRTCVELEVHLADTAAQARRLVDAVGLLDDERASLVVRAAGWHDVGKAHRIFQEAIVDPPTELPLAKATSFRRYGRAGFRHELVSALAAVEAGEPDLVAYLCATHHGKVRLSLRPLQWHQSEAQDAIRGVMGADSLPSIATPTGATPELETLPIELSRLGRDADGRPSWSERALRLLGSLGPFRLAYLEMLVRIADWRASGEPSATVGEH